MRRNNPNCSNTAKSWHGFLLTENCSIHPLICLPTLCRFAFLYDFLIKTNVSESKKSFIRSSGIRLFGCITQIFGSGMWDNDLMCSFYWFSNKTTDNSMIWNIKVCLQEKHLNSIPKGTTDLIVNQCLRMTRKETKYTLQSLWRISPSANPSSFSMNLRTDWSCKHPKKSNQITFIQSQYKEQETITETLRFCTGESSSTTIKTRSPALRCSATTLSLRHPFSSTEYQNTIILRKTKFLYSNQKLWSSMKGKKKFHLESNTLIIFLVELLVNLLIIFFSLGIHQSTHIASVKKEIRLP